MTEGASAQPLPALMVYCPLRPRLAATQAIDQAMTVGATMSSQWQHPLKPLAEHPLKGAYQRHATSYHTIRQHCLHASASLYACSTPSGAPHPAHGGLPQANPVVTAVQVTSSHHAQPARSFWTAMLPQCVYTFASAKTQGDKQGCQKWDGFPVKAVLQSQCNTSGATKHHQAVLPPYPTLPYPTHPKGRCQDVQSVKQAGSPAATMLAVSRDPKPNSTQPLAPV